MMCTAPALGALMFAPVSGSPFATGSQPYSVAFSPDGKLLATANIAESTVSVFSHDTTAPTITGPGDLTREATSASGAVVSYDVYASDPDSPVAVVCDRPSGSTFPLGATVVQCTASDPSGNTASASFTVTVQDTTVPAITVPSSVTREATSGQGAIVSYTVSASDLVDGQVSVTCAPSSGSTFPIGTTTVTCTATDNAGNTSHGSFDVVVADTTGPVIMLPPTITAEATGPAGANVTYTVTAHDAVDGQVTPSCTPTSGSTFRLGATRVSCTATDKARNASTGVFEVLVRDTTPPALKLPHGMIVGARGPQDAIVFYSAIARDLVDGLIAPNCKPASGSQFALGTSLVRCTAADKSRNTSRGTFTVTVKATAPWLTNITQTHERWASGTVLPHYANAHPPVGTTLTYTLNQPAQVTFRFVGTTTGRLVAGTCVPGTNQNRANPLCRRSITATLRHQAHAGKNSLHFEGRLTPTRLLPPATYTVKITATANGHRSYVRILQFTIIH
jgi:hypothetical protein